jgi:putative ABC transport system permease protein
MDAFFQEIRYGLRVLGRSPGFTTLSVITLALGVGMATAIFSVFYGVLLRPLRYERPDRIVDLHEVNPQGHQMQFADPNFEDVRSDARSLDGAAEYASTIEAVSGGSEPTRTEVALVSRDFFPILRIAPVQGRSFRAEDHRFGAAPVALVGYGYWKQFLGGAADLSSRKLTIASQPVSIIGVLPPRFSFPARAEIWLPRELYERYPSRTAHNWHVIARLRDGSSIAGTRAELQTIATRLKQQYGPDTMMTSVSVVPLREAMTGDVRAALWMLLAAVGLLLLIACANVANLLLVQSAARRHEIAIRFALGGTRSRVVRQVLVEALWLSLASGVLGVLAAFWGVRALLAVSPDVLPRMADVAVSIPVLVFALGVCMVVAVGLGVFTGLRSSADLQHALAAGGRSQGGAFVSQRTSRAIVAGQLAVTLTLLTGAVLLGRSLLNVLSVNPGFRTERVITMSLALSSVSDDQAKSRRVQFLDDLFARLRAVPGVEEVGGTSNLPLTGFHPDGAYLVMNPGEALPGDMRQLEQLFHDRARTGDAEYAAIGDGYLAALGIPLLRGRVFDARDTTDSPHVAVVSESVARDRWPGRDPLGRQIEFGNMDGDLRLLTVVGVVGDVRADTLERPAFPTIYVNVRQRPQSSSTFAVVIRTSADPATITSTARQVVRDLDPSVPPKFATLAEVVSGSVESRRFNAIFLGVFAGTALLLAVAGMYGVMAYSVTRRTNEIGVRMALGASRTTILSLVLGQGMLTAAIGVAVGIVASFAMTRTMRSMLFGLNAADPLTFTAVALLLMCVALLASYLPARRATRVDPMVALRYE